MKTALVIVLIILVFVPEAYPIKCYVCQSSDGNCKTGEKDCTSLVDTCLKTVVGKSVTKSCTTSDGCDLAKSACDKSGECKTYCCKKDLCNGSLNLKPLAATVFLAPVAAVVLYLM
ncbi:CD59 glycoprotein-like [Actinia tenebrosa]|uniref:CD59 glycoprotein-like n=1 Tax=Actinia tenebrosa TaxID=6105 RepID=A0A6P8HMV9_ACTTE|nr:CD59 glycoprotein-like [Actinia tenebrosa]